MIRKGLIFVVLSIFVSAAFSQSERKYIRKGNNEFEEKDYTNSEIAYRKAVEERPGSFDAQFNIGDALYKQEKYQEAAEKFSEISNSDVSKEKKARAYHNLGNSLLKANKLEESIEAYKQALKNDPNDIETKHNLTYALRKLKQQQNQKNQQNKDQQKQDQNKKNQNQEKDQQNKDQNKQNQQNQNKKDQQDQKKEDQKQQQKQQQKPEISKEDAKRLLQALENDEKQLQKKLKKKKAEQAQTAKTTKNW